MPYDASMAVLHECMSNLRFPKTRRLVMKQQGCTFVPESSMLSASQAWFVDGRHVGNRICQLGATAVGTVSVSRGAAEAGQGQKEWQEVLWQDFFSDPWQWWDYRADAKSPQYPDFRHKTSKQALWLNNVYKPEWVDEELARRDVGLSKFTTSMVETLSRHCENGAVGEAVEVLELLVQRGCSVSLSVFRLVLKNCGSARDVGLGKRVHALAVRSGYESNAFLANHVICMYACHGELEEAVQVFGKVPVPDAYMWSSMILAFARQGKPAEAIRFYLQMRESGVEPDNHIFVAVLKACANAADLVSGKQVHADIMTSGVRPNVFVGNSLVNMYAKCGSLDDAREVFEGLETRDSVTWNAIITGYTQQGMGGESLALYSRMLQEGIAPADQATFVCLLKACASAGALQEGRQLHELIQKRRLEGDVVVGSCLIDLYSQWGSVEDARRVFDGLPTKDVVAWTAMITGYAQQGMAEEALFLYESMLQEGITVPNRVTFLSLFQACATVGAVQQGMQLHAQIRERGLETDVLVGNCLVDMYAKCGRLEDARSVFDALPIRDVVTWSALLNGYAEHSDGHMAFQCFREMLQQGVKPNGTTFSSLLVACSHAGLVLEGLQYFRMMVDDYGIVPDDHHYSCMVDLLGRAGRLDEAENILLTMSLDSYIVGWTSLLSACKSYGDVERGERCFQRLVEIEPEVATPYVLLCSMYANAARWEELDHIESLRKEAGAWKKPAKACIEVKNRVHEFTVGEERSDVASMLRDVSTKLKLGGHVPETWLVLKAASEQEKEDALCGHAEKLALAYGLLNTPDGTTLLVTKNLRMCHDCHSSTKIMSHVENREIIVRDVHRVHRFLNGACSCGDRH